MKMYDDDFNFVRETFRERAERQKLEAKIASKYSTLGVWGMITTFQAVWSAVMIIGYIVWTGKLFLFLMMSAILLTVVDAALVLLYSKHVKNFVKESGIEEKEANK